ncbi:MAG: hypothetical protein WBR35_00055, partial [Anaerolineae bacterium]
MHIEDHQAGAVGHDVGLLILDLDGESRAVRAVTPQGVWPQGIADINDVQTSAVSGHEQSRPLKRQIEAVARQIQKTATDRAARIAHVYDQDTRVI